MDYDELVRRLRAAAATSEVDPDECADAITNLRAERDDAIRHLADWSNRCGQTEAERDALAARHERALIAGAELRKERDALAEDVEQLRVQLAGCSVIAGSNTKDSLARAMPGKDAYGYSASLADVERCVRREIALRTERDALREEVSLRRHTMPAEYAKLLAQRDYAMEMVNVQDGQIDALRALLKVARDCIYSLDAREIYDDELARIDAALAKDKP